MTFEWKIARTQAHLHNEHGYVGVTVSLRYPPTFDVLKAMNLPALPPPPTFPTRRGLENR